MNQGRDNRSYKRRFQTRDGCPRLSWLQKFRVLFHGSHNSGVVTALPIYTSSGLRWMPFEGAVPCPDALLQSCPAVTLPVIALFTRRHS